VDGLALAAFALRAGLPRGAEGVELDGTGFPGADLGAGALETGAGLPDAVGWALGSTCANLSGTEHH